jgi:steroid delta-isomerase-like uncharacterized protein
MISINTKYNIIFFFLISSFIIITYSSCNNKNKHVKENKTTAKLFITLINNRDINKLLSLFSDNCLYEEVASGRSYSDKKGIAAYIKSTLSGIPDSKFEIDSIITNNKMAMVEWTWKGTNTVGWKKMGIPATNKYFEIRGVSIIEFENKLIRRVSDYWDWNTFLKGIGVK